MPHMISGRIDPRANVYFDGKCISHTVETDGGPRITVGVIMPSRLLFNTEAPEKIEVVSGACRIRHKGSETWESYSTGQSFSAPGNSAFDIEVSETLHYICYYG